MKENKAGLTSHEDVFCFLMSDEAISSFGAVPVSRVTRWTNYWRAKSLGNADFPELRTRFLQSQEAKITRHVLGHEVVVHKSHTLNSDSSDRVCGAVYEIDGKAYRVNFFSDYSSDEVAATCESGEFQAVSYMTQDTHGWFEKSFENKFSHEFVDLFSQKAPEDIFSGSEYQFIWGYRHLYKDNIDFRIAVKSQEHGLIEVTPQNPVHKLVHLKRLSVDIFTEIKFVENDVEPYSCFISKK